MSTRVFFMLALLSPVLVAAHAFGGAFYILMAVALTAHIAQISTRRRLFWLFILTPPIFALGLVLHTEASGVVPVMVGTAIGALFNVMHLSAATRQELVGSHLSALLTLGVCVSFFGYIYVAIARVLWQCLGAFGVIRDNLAA